MIEIAFYYKNDDYLDSVHENDYDSDRERELVSTRSLFVSRLIARPTPKRAS